MSKNPLRLKIAYLYPDFLQGFCSRANLDAFKMRANERNIEITIDEIKNDDKIHSSKYDFYYISGSNISMLDICNKHLKNNYAELQIALESNSVMLAINCGYVLFSKNYQLNNSRISKGAGIFNSSCKISENPTYKKIIGTCDFLDKNKTIAGFSNTLMENTEFDDKPFLTLKKNEKEGSRYNNALGTYITSPLLAQNPYFCDYLIALCLKVKYKCSIPLAKLCDDIEWYSHNYLLEAK